MRARVSSLVGLVLFSGACGGVQRGTSSPAPQAASIEARTAAAAETRNRFLAAFEARDSVLLASFLAPSFELVTIEQDTVRGPAAAVGKLLALGAAEPAPLRLYGGKLEACIGSDLIERDAGFTGPAAPGAPAGSFRQGSYAALWTESAGSILVRRIELSPRRRSGPPPTGCKLEYVRASMSQRFIASLALETTPLRPTRGIEAVGSALTAQGYGFIPPEDPSRRFPFVRTTVGGLTAGLRYRMRGPWSTGVQAGVRMPEEAEGFTTANKRQRIIIESLPINITTLLHYQRGIARLGAGPSMLLQNFTVTETHEWPTYYYKGEWQWQKASAERNTGSSLAPAVGLATELAIVLPMARRSQTELRIGYAGYGKSSVPATPYFAGADVSNSVASLAVAVGLGW